MNFNLFPLCEPLVYRFRPVLQFWSGVDLFFVVSGFVIARTLLPDLRACSNLMETRLVIVAFWMRRAARLLPSAWLWLGLILAGAAFYNRSDAWGSVRANLDSTVASVLNLQNFHFMRCFPGRIGASFPYWTLSLEEQFYLLLPLLALLTKRMLPLILALLVVVQFPATRLASPTPLSLFLNLSRSDGFALGVLLALWSGHSSWTRCAPTILLRLGAARCLVTVGMVGLVALAAGYGQRVSSSALGWVALAAALNVFVASYNMDLLWPPGWGKRLLLWAGSRSYGMYIVHIPCFAFVRETWFRASGGHSIVDAHGGHITALLALSLVGFVAELNYRYVESPLRGAGRRWAARISSGSHFRSGVAAI